MSSASAPASRRATPTPRDRDRTAGCVPGGSLVSEEVLRGPLGGHEIPWAVLGGPSGVSWSFLGTTCGGSAVLW